MRSPNSVLSGIRPSWAILLWLLFASFGAGQSSTNQSAQSDSEIRWPYTFQAKGFRFYSLVPPKVLDPHLSSLVCLPDEIEQATSLALEKIEIHVLVFDTRRSLDEYLHRYYPGMRAANSMYVRGPSPVNIPGLVLTWFHSDWLVDARHEATHAILHSKHTDIPLWIDEGLAEYFEYPPEQPNSNQPSYPKSHPIHTKLIQTQLRFGQFANLQEQERWDPNRKLSNQQYRDAWGSVAFLLHHDEGTKLEFQTYLRDLFDDRASGHLSFRLRRSIPDWRIAYVRYFRDATIEPPNR